jgi:hypothetical protein
MAARKLSRVATTRRIVKDLPSEYDDLVSVAYLYAEISDDESERAGDRIKAGQAWAEVVQAMGARTTEEARREVSWIQSKPRAV